MHAVQYVNNHAIHIESNIRSLHNILAQGTFHYPSHVRTHIDNMYMVEVHNNYAHDS